MSGFGTGLIGAKIAGAPAALAARLTAKARRIAATHAENRLLARNRDASRWRNARLLWPLFTDGDS